MLSSFWSGFLKFAEKEQQKSPIIFSILKQLKPIEMTQEKVIVSCENNGVRLYLEKKIPLIEDLVSTYLEKKITLELIVEEKKRKKEEPLFQFEPNKSDLALRAGLLNRYNFTNFAVSSTNQVAFAAAQAVARNPGTSYNPLFLYGGVGVGKTHLAQAIGREILEKNPQMKVFFCPGDQFLNELVEAIKEHTTNRFRKKYRQLNGMVVDDIQFIAGKQSVQEEFFHTFNAVVSSGGQVILTSDRPPHEIGNLEDRLRSRFSGGLIVDVQPPEFELRTAIVLIKAREKNIEIDIEAAKIIAEQVGDARALEGALLSTYAKIVGKKERIDLEAVELFFQEKTRRTTRRVSTHDVIRIVCSFYNIKQTHIKSANRAEEIVLPRQIIMYLLRQELKLKFEEIAYHLKRKDHTTIMHGVEKINRLIIKDPLLKQEIDGITKTIISST